MKTKLTRLWSFLLALVMVVGLLPTVAYAETSTVYITKIEINNFNPEFHTGMTGTAAKNSLTFSYPDDANYSKGNDNRYIKQNGSFIYDNNLTAGVATLMISVYANPFGNNVENPAYDFDEANLNSIEVWINGEKRTDVEVKGYNSAWRKVDIYIPVTVSEYTGLTHTVSFAANGGTGSMADVTGVSGEYTLPANGFTAPAGKQFKCWSVDGVEKAVGDKITVTANTTVTAVWEAIEYNVTVIGGTASVGAGTPITKATMGTTVTLTAGAAPSGQMFDKWIVNGVVVADANSATTTFVMPAGAVSVTATYKTLSPDEYTVTFNANGHGTAPVAQTVESGKTAAKPANPSEDGWTFCGWYTNQDCIQSQYFDFSTAITGDITLYAKWKQNEISDTYWSGLYTDRSPHGKVNLNGYGISINTGSYFAAETELIAYAYPDEGYRFKEWQDEAGDVVSTNNPYTFTLNSATYLYAIFEVGTADPIATYTVTFNANGHGTAPVAQTVESGKTAAKPANPSEDGWTFCGWYTNQDCSQSQYFDFSTAITGDITLYAKWKQNEISDTYWSGLYTNRSPHGKVNLNGYGISTNTGSYFAAETELIAYAYPDEGYRFKEWQDEAGDVVSTNNPYTFTLNSATYLYAIFEAAPTASTEYDITVTGGKATVGAGTEITKAAEGTEVTLTANAAPYGQVFDKWEVVSGSITLANANSTPTTFTMPAGAVSVTATYKAAPHTHTFDQEIATADYKASDATCTAKATYYKSCACGEKGTETFEYGELADHNWNPATCTAPKTCSVCDVTEGTALGHDFADAWSSDASGHWHACSRCDVKDGEAAHTPDREAATETDPIKCTECDYIITAALGHTHSLTKVEAKAPTCTEDGNIEYYTCSGCSKLFADATGNVEITADKTVDKATGHTYEWVIDKEATATEKGSKHEECKVCHDKKAAVEIPATGTPTDPTDPVEPTDPSKPTESNPDTGASDNPQTGDNRMMALSIAVLFVSGFGVVATAVYGKKKKSVK